jgi:colanic acid biosynthesis glycosyl transferase WcaI
VVCSRQRYDDADASLAPLEILGGVKIHRVASTRLGRARLIGRAIDYASFYVTCGCALIRMLRAGDVLVAKTDPPLISIPCSLIARLNGAVLVNWQQDVFPEVASELGANPLPHRLDRLLRRMRDFSLHAAYVNVLIGSRMFDYLASRNIPRHKLCVIENWADADAIAPKAPAASALRTQLGLQDKVVTCYSGNLGRAHEFSTLLAAAEALRREPCFAFVMIGSGAKMPLLRQAVAELRLGNFYFLPYQPRESLSDSLAAADVHVVSLLPALEGLIVPSKLYGILAAGRPLVFIGEPDGEIARVLRDADCGLSIAVDAGADLAAALRMLRAQPEIRAGMGRRARDVLVAKYSARTGLEKWIGVLEPILASRSAAASLPALLDR